MDLLVDKALKGSSIVAPDSKVHLVQRFKGFYDRHALPMLLLYIESSLVSCVGVGTS